MLSKRAAILGHEAEGEGTGQEKRGRKREGERHWPAEAGEKVPVG